VIAAAIGHWSNFFRSFNAGNGSLPRFALTVQPADFPYSLAYGAGQRAWANFHLPLEAAPRDVLNQVFGLYRRDSCWIVRHPIFLGQDLWHYIL